LPADPHAIHPESESSHPLLVLLPSDWSNLWNQIRQWHETSSATRVRVSILPPLGPRSFMIDSEASSRIDVFAAAGIVVVGKVVGRVELGFPAVETTPLAAETEARLWADRIGWQLATGTARQAPPSQAA
jgi:hypothetical protein